MKRFRHRNSVATPQEVDGFFDDDQFGHREGEVKVRDLPYLARQIIEYVHEVKPDVVIGGDRGGRFISLATMMGWKHRFPGERFPTIDGRIHIARVTNRSAAEDQVTRATHIALDRAGLADWRQQTSRRDGDSPKVMYLDDWAVYGDTARLFVRAAGEYGLPAHALRYATMISGMKAIDLPRGVDHFIADPGRDHHWAEWDTHESDLPLGMTGVMYHYNEPTFPVADPNLVSLDARRRLADYTDLYYANYTSALQAGELTLAAR